MYKILIFFLIYIMYSAFPASSAASGKHPTDSWNYYHFDGIAFTSGPAVDGNAYVAVREKVRPLVLTAQTLHLEQTPLPDGEGVIAGICYLHSSGGKLGSGSGFTPYPRVALQISSGGKEFVTIQTDDHGYFVVVLPAGTYSVGSAPFAAKITVERGVTTLVPLRAGKRMVD